MAEIRVAINGITGRMGTETVSALLREEDLSLVGGVCLHDRGPQLSLADGGKIPLSTNLEGLLEETAPDVLVDFTNAQACMEAAAIAGGRSISMVLGASGLTNDHLNQLDAMANDKGIGIVVAPNFALGAVVLKRLLEQAAPYFEYVDIVESHHEAKIDAPSGFALALAKAIGDAKEFRRNQAQVENLPGTRGGDYNGVSVHSIRMQGRSAHHEIVLGAPGQTLTLRHDTLGRDCYMPGVMRCIRDVVERKGLVVGLENLLGL